MNNHSNSFGSILKSLTVGAIIGSIATMVVANNNKMCNKIKSVAENARENVSSILKTDNQ